ncbi:MAG TPA: hypothetical protein PK252_11910 [Bacteroidales bacterium]|nr:hypothetical protein [Bacteroidales bacterium]
MQIILTIFFITIFFYPLIGQEEAIPFDTKGKIWVIDKKVIKTIKLFKDEEVIEARLFTINDSISVFEKLIKKDDKTFRDKQILSNSELNSLRAKIDSISLMVINQEGRSWLLASSTFLGLTLYGPSVPSIINSTNDKIQVSSYMLTAASGFFLPWYLTRNRSVSYAHLNLTTFGLSWGFLHGAQIYWATSGYNNLNNALTFGTICGITEGFIGYNLVDKFNISYGQAQLMTFYSEIGLFIGFAAAQRFNIDAEEKPGGFQGLSLLGSALGLGIGYRQGLDKSITAGDAQIIGISALLSAYLTIPPLSDIAPDDSRNISTTLSLAGICGAFIGSKLIRNIDFSYGQSLMIGLGTIAGGFTGAGVGYLIDNNSSLPIYISGLGALTSFGLMFNYYKNKSETSYEKNNFRINLYPQNYLVWNRANLQPIYLTNLPLVSISKTF